MSRKFPRHSITLNQLFAGILLFGLAVLFVVGYTVFQQERSHSGEQWQQDSISQSAALTSSYYSILIPKLILGEKEEIENLLKRTQIAENLLSIAIVPESEISNKVLETCRTGLGKAFFHQAPTCYEKTRESLRVFHELRSAGHNVGYLVKELSLPEHSFLGTTFFGKNLLLILICFIAVNAISLVCLRQFVMRPTKRIIESLKQTGKVEITHGQYRLSELQLLGSSLHRALTSIEEYQERAKQLEYDAKIGRISCQVAHDLCSPLSSLQAGLEYLRGIEIKDQRFVDVMKLFNLSFRRLTGIADDLLLKYRGGEEKRSVFSLHRILTYLLEEYGGQERFEKIQFERCFEKEAVELIGDANRLQRAIGNIIKNGIEAVGFAGTISVGTKRSGDRIEIFIADTGPGMSVEKLKKVLQGGFTEGKKEGHGIGMTVVKEAVELFHGELTGTSQIGRGTIFLIRLPLPREEALLEMRKKEGTEKTITIKVCEDEPVVVIDDEPSMRAQWSFLLREHGVCTILCSSYEDIEEQGISSTLSRTAIVDYSYDNSQKTGADILRLLQAKGFDHLYLCTAESWRAEVKEVAEKCGATLFGKPSGRVRVERISALPQPSPVEGVILKSEEDNPLL